MPPVYGGLTLTRGATVLDVQSEEIFLDLMPLGYFGPADVKGKDDIAPGKAGRFRRNRVYDIRKVELRGHIRGVGGSRVERQQSWNMASEALGSILSPVDDTPLTITVLAPYMGLEAGSAALEAYAVDWITDEPHNSMSFSLWTIELHSIADPPEWVLDESS